MGTEKTKNISELNTVLKKFDIDGDPHWLAVILFVRNLVQRMSIFAAPQKAEIQLRIFRELEKKDFSEKSLNKVISMLEGFLLQTTRALALEEALAAEKSSASLLLKEMATVFETIRGTSSSHEKRLGEIQEQTVDVIESNKDKSVIVGQFRGLFQGMVAEFKEEAEQLEARAQQLEKTANFDPLLTGLHNRRALDVHLSESFSRLAQQNTPISFILIDVDHFKKVNDTYGHQAGDDVLRQLAAIVESQAIQFQGFGARYGGEELVIVAEGLPLNKAVLKAEAIRADVESYLFRISPGDKLHGKTLQCTISAGVSECKPGWEPEDMIRAADLALYRAKESGRNTVMSYTGDQV